MAKINSSLLVTNRNLSKCSTKDFSHLNNDISTVQWIVKKNLILEYGKWK